MRDEVRWFVVLADEENATAAAAQLHMPQPTLSRKLGRLERQLGTRLFDRIGRRLVLNDAGRIYAEHLRRADAELAAGEQRVRELGTPADRVVRLGFLHSFGTWLVPQLIQQARAADPALRFDLVQDAAETISGLVLDGSLDLGIVSPRPAASGLRWRRLLRQDVHLAVPAASPLARETTIDFAQLADVEFVAMGRGFGMRQLLDEACAAAGVEPRISVECQELDTVAGLVAAGIGVALLPDSPNTRVPPGVVLLGIRGVDAAREVGLVWARDRALPEPARRVRDLAG
ncbi:LysR family transcriptional regulator [Flexivirga meconopsidis]|uniref:LysR family transcriptional regulator n=1 Tax=Flexivirga meconopsidis TaxID=2977121 RepID=UPI00223F111C|nr:LysR family transcriptional regulator [Flexivirga meconopsidis]